MLKLVRAVRRLGHALKHPLKYFAVGAFAVFIVWDIGSLSQNDEEELGGVCWRKNMCEIRHDPAGALEGARAELRRMMSEELTGKNK